jgi:TPP-dependent trihydroxycyclohexane-1,2-dione (THcHDO) dehydratase
MKTTAKCVEDLARHFDENGKPEQPITVNATREYMRRFFKPEKRGGVLLCGRHEVYCRGFPCPEPEQLDIEQVTS